MQVILGIDPGLASTGIAVLSAELSTLRYLHASVISTSSGMPHGERLEKIYAIVRDTVQSYQPQEAGIEALFFAKNVSSALPVAAAMGVIMLALQHENVSFSQYSPKEIKKSVVGISSASKEQVQEMTKVLLGMRQHIVSSHASDALAVAITHAHHRGAARVS